MNSEKNPVSAASIWLLMDD